MATSQTDKANRFLELHRPGHPLLMPNAWDLGSAAVLASLGFEALATTSSGHAATLGRLDGAVTRDEALDHASALARGTDLPVSADLENGFADDPASVADTIGLAVQAGLAGCSVEDYSGGEDARIYDLGLARERVAVRGAPTVAELASLGVARISVGGAFAFAALAALCDGAEELREKGTYGYLDSAAAGVKAARSAFAG